MSANALYRGFGIIPANGIKRDIHQKLSDDVEMETLGTKRPLFPQFAENALGRITFSNIIEKVINTIAAFFNISRAPSRAEFVLDCLQSVYENRPKYDGYSEERKIEILEEKKKKCYSYPEKTLYSSKNNDLAIYQNKTGDIVLYKVERGYYTNFNESAIIPSPEYPHSLEYNSVEAYEERIEHTLVREKDVDTFFQELPEIIAKLEAKIRELKQQSLFAAR